MATVVVPTLEGQAARPTDTPPALVHRDRLPRTRRLLSIALAAAAFVAAWWYVAPPELGGSTSFVTVDGTSMLPALKRSDLVALRPADTYRVGDIVGYRSLFIHRVVLHRIIAIHGGHYVFKGDNNSFVDPDRPTRAQLVGRLWIHVSSAGQLVQQLHRPPVAGALAVVLVLLAGIGGSPKRRRPA